MTVLESSLRGMGTIVSSRLLGPDSTTVKPATVRCVRSRDKIMNRDECFIVGISTAYTLWLDVDESCPRGRGEVEQFSAQNSLKMSTLGANFTHAFEISLKRTVRTTALLSFLLWLHYTLDFRPAFSAFVWPSRCSPPSARKRYCSDHLMQYETNSLWESTPAHPSRSAPK